MTTAHDHTVAEIIPTMLQPLEFEYVNHRKMRYTYKVLPLSIEYGYYHPDGGGIVPVHMRDDYVPMWVLNADVITRDGDPRDDMGTRRRTFIFDKIRNPRNP